MLEVILKKTKPSSQKYFSQESYSSDQLTKFLDDIPTSESNKFTELQIKTAIYEKYPSYAICDALKQIIKSSEKLSNIKSFNIILPSADNGCINKIKALLKQIKDKKSKSVQLIYSDEVNATNKKDIQKICSQFKVVDIGIYTNSTVEPDSNSHISMKFKGGSTITIKPGDSIEKIKSNFTKIYDEGNNILCSFKATCGSFTSNFPVEINCSEKKFIYMSQIISQYIMLFYNENHTKINKCIRKGLKKIMDIDDDINAPNTNQFCNEYPILLALGRVNAINKTARLDSLSSLEDQDSNNSDFQNHASDQSYQTDVSRSTSDTIATNSACTLPPKKRYLSEIQSRNVETQEDIDNERISLNHATEESQSSTITNNEDNYMPPRKKWKKAYQEENSSSSTEARDTNHNINEQELSNSDEAVTDNAAHKSMSDNIDNFKIMVDQDIYITLQGTCSKKNEVVLIIEVNIESLINTSRNIQLSKVDWEIVNKRLNNIKNEVYQVLPETKQISDTNILFTSQVAGQVEQQKITEYLYKLREDINSPSEQQYSEANWPIYDCYPRDVIGNLIDDSDNLT